jgi:predicted membrane protein
MDPQGFEPEQKRGTFLSGRVLFGIAIIAVGLGLLLDYYDVIEAESVWQFWPVLLMLAGMVKLSRGIGPGDRFFGAVLLIVGTLILLTNLLPDFDVPWRLLWPLAIIVVGLMILTPALRRRKRTQSIGGSWINQSAIFGGGDMRVDSQAFRGGDLSATFGGMDIDLRNARLAGDGAEIELFVAFGGVDLRVPADWEVVIRVTPIFGAVDDERKPTAASPTPAGGPTPAMGAASRTAAGRRLTLRGMVLFGGVDIKD